MRQLGVQPVEQLGPEAEDHVSLPFDVSTKSLGTTEWMPVWMVP